MRQDWSTPFTPDIISQIQEFCVQCSTKEAYLRLYSMLDVSRAQISSEWYPGHPCMRVANGVAVGRWPTDRYEQARYADIPKFTFDYSLPDLPIVDISVASLFE